jgi:hypothetical protein
MIRSGENTRVFWIRIENFLRRYNNEWTPPEYIEFFKHREGWFVLTRSGVLVGLNFMVHLGWLGCGSNTVTMS